MKRFINWLTRKISPRKASPDSHLRQSGAYLRHTGSHRKPGADRTITRPAKPKPAVPKRQPEFVDFDRQGGSRIDSIGPGKNVLMRNKYVREDTGTHETLKILDESMLETDEDEGFDPYNTGQFDRSRNWDKRTK
jgi:hypothetical protein